MWLEIQSFIESLLEKYGLWRVLIGPFLVIGVVGGFGLITNRGAASFVAVMLSFAIAILLIIFLALQWRTLATTLRARDKILTRYADRFVKSSANDTFSIEDWRETAIVGRAGDASIERRITLLAGAEGLYTVCITNYSTSADELTLSRRRKVKVQARSFNEQDELGARYDLTTNWIGSRQRAFIHFHNPVPANTIVRIWVQCEWPRLCTSVLNGQPSVIEWKFRRDIKRLAATMIFEKYFGVPGPLSITAFQGSVTPNQVVQADRSTVVSVEYLNLPKDSTVGFLVDRPNAG